MINENLTNNIKRRLDIINMEFRLLIQPLIENDYLDKLINEYNPKTKTYKIEITHK